MNTCDQCKNWIESSFKEEGNCNLFKDENDGIDRNDICYGWDYEGYKAGVTVMAKFGCIHWEAK